MRVPGDEQCPSKPNSQSPGLGTSATESAARTLGLQIQSIEVHSPEDLDGAFTAILSQRPGALITAETSVTLNAQARIAAFAAANRIPALYPFKEFVVAGGLMSYGLDFKESST